MKIQRLILEQDKNLFLTQLMKEFEKTENDLFDYMNILKDWAETQKHFPEAPADNILKFVILYNKFSIEKAKQKLDMYYTIRTLIPDMFTQNPLSNLMVEVSQSFISIPLPKPTDDYKRIVYCQFNPNYGPGVFDLTTYVTHYIHVLELLIETDDCLSFHLVANFDGFRASHVSKMNPMAVKKFTIIMEKVFSNRIASMHFFNLPSVAEIVVNKIIKPGLNRKLRERLQVTSTANLDILINKFGKERLPRDLGGDLPSVAELNGMLFKQFEHYKARFDKLQVMKVDESQRSQTLENDEILGYYGNFKKINVD